MTVSRRHFLAAPAALLRGADSPRSLLLFSEAQAPRLRAFGKADRAGRIEKHAAAALAAGPWSVTFKRPRGRNLKAGPCDNVKLTFLEGQTRFVNYNPGV